MSTSATNSILRKVTIGFLVLLIVLAPLCFTITAEAQDWSGSGGRYTPPSDTTAPSTAAAPAATTPTATTPPAAPGGTKPAASDWKTELGAWFGDQILSLAAYFTGKAGMLLASTIDRTVIGMGKFITKDTSIGAAINQSWTIIRDICNLLFIFGFVYIGIKTILDSDDSGTKSLVAKIIIGALLINFSLYFTKVVIDVSNFLATEIYTQATGGASTITPRGDIGLQFANQLGIGSLYKTAGTAEFKNVTGGGMLWFYIMGAIFLLITTFVLAAGAILLIIRFVALIFIMIFSPILFAGTIFPKTQGAVEDLWGKLISYSFFAPVYFLLLFISLKITGATTATLRGDTPMSSGMAGTQFESFGVILNFLIIIMFMIMSLLAAQKMSIAGGSQAIKFGNTLRGYGQRAVGASTAGLAAKIGRSTVGRVGNTLADKKWLKDAAAKGGPGGFGARQLFKASKATGDATFDARNIAGVGGALGIGEGRKGGYTTIQKEIKEKEEKFAQSLGQLDDSDPRVAARKAEAEKAKRDYNAQLQVLQRKIRDIKDEENDTDEELEEKKRRRADVQAQIDELEKDMKDAEIAYEKEKQRRIIGSTFAQPEKNKEEIRALKENIRDRKKIMKQNWKDYAEQSKNMSDEERKDTIDRYAEHMKAIEDAEDKYKDLLKSSVPDRGYAGVMEKGSWWNTWIYGRMVAHENEAGKEIRKTAEKGLPKEK